MLQYAKRTLFITRKTFGDRGGPVPPSLTIWILVGLLGWASCDGLVDPPSAVHPEVRLTWEQPHLLSTPSDSKRGSTSTPEATYQLVLQVTNLLGDDFSPDPITILDTESEARIALSLPPESEYRFSVRFLRGGTLVAEGGAIHHVRSDTRIVDVPIVPLTDGIATVGFQPGFARLRQDDNEWVELRLRLYGTGDPISGLVCRIDVEGINSESLQFSGAELARAETGRLDLAWSWSQPVQSDLDLGTLRVPRSAAATIRLQITSGNLRSVNAEGTITPLQAVGAEVEITP